VRVGLGIKDKIVHDGGGKDEGGGTQREGGGVLVKKVFAKEVCLLG